jgi:hypothetical protein
VAQIDIDVATGPAERHIAGRVPWRPSQPATPAVWQPTLTRVIEIGNFRMHDFPPPTIPKGQLFEIERG